ncbi:glycosyltransferase [Gaetbulibacter sp. M235]|uniref:glycosyltransferase n=1 Tax=Gaetbulibacter sp. M235 TaxID=3126510 RepID=UPI00374EBFAA
MRTLTIISHTEHYKKTDGNIVGLGSTITEINHLLGVFDAIIHVAMLHNTPAPLSALPYVSNKITFIALPAVGGTSLRDKLAIVFKAPEILKTIKKAIDQTDYFQFRAPTGIGVYVIPYLILFCTKKGWFKYAGNWKQHNAPLAYSFQRWLLKKQKRTVTINGRWPDQPNHCLTFENPCLTEDEISQGQTIMRNKDLTKQAISFCFVGRLEEAKGLDLIIETFKKLSSEEKLKVKTVHIVGNGKAKQEYKNKVLDSGIDFKFHGFLSRAAVHDIYKKSHVILLPSASEGFPKVIAEAMNYGCIPIVSDISSLGHYIKNNENGFLLKQLNVSSLKNCISAIFILKPHEYLNIKTTSLEFIEQFSYSYYNKHLLNEILI